MYVVMIASECAPVAKVGGLADVVFGLSRELELRGHTVEIVLPPLRLHAPRPRPGPARRLRGPGVPWDGGAIRCTVWFGFVHGRRCFFVEPHSQQASSTAQPTTVSGDDPQRFASSARRRSSSCSSRASRPQVIHTH